MGRYFGIVNSTKNQCVSSYWKGSPPSIQEMLYFIHYFGWKNGDKISSSSYCDVFLWNWSNTDWSMKEYIMTWDEGWIVRIDDGDIVYEPDETDEKITEKGEIE